MNIRSIAGTAARLAMILLFILALAGCGDDAGDMDAAPDEPEPMPMPEVVPPFDNADGYHKGQSADFSQSVRPTSDGRYGFVLQRSGHVAPGHLLDDNRIYIVDSGLALEAHGDHFDPVTRAPTLLPYQLGHGGREYDEGESGLYNPVHFVSHHGFTAIFYDGINPARSDDPNAVEQEGVAVVYRDSQFDGSTMPPMPIFEMGVDHYSHGAAVAVHNDVHGDDHGLFIVTLAEDGALPNGVATYTKHEHGDHFDNELVQSFADTCPRLHGEAIWGPYVAFGCVANGDARYLDDDGNPLVAEGILVLTAITEDGDVAKSIKYADSFEATVVAYPLAYTSGALAATTRHEVGHDDVIFMARYGPNGQDFLKITEHNIEEGLDAEPEVLTMEWGSDDRHRAFAFEPVDGSGRRLPDGSARRLLIQDQGTDGENYHLDVLELGDEDPTGKGRFVVLTATGDLHIFDLATSDVPATIPGIVGADCPEEDICPSLALAPDFAYVSDPANGKVYEVHLEHAEIERTFDDDLTVPTQVVVLGRFGKEDIDPSHAH